MNKPGVYRIHCKGNKKNYIGCSRTDIMNRLGHHRHLLSKGVHTSKRLQEDWDRFGSTGFVFEPLVDCSPEYILATEKACIKEWDSTNPEKGYNTRADSGARHQAGRRCSDDPKIRFSCRIRPGKVKAIAALIEWPEDDLIRLVHGENKGWKGGGRVVAIREEESTDDMMSRLNSIAKEKDMKPVSMASASEEVIVLRKRVAELSAKVKEYEIMLNGS